MIQTLKKEFWKDTDKIVQLLETFGFAHIKEHHNYISFGRDENSSPKSIVLYKENNEGLFLKDYARNSRCDLITLIQTEKAVEFRDVVKTMRKISGVSWENYWEKTQPFGGLFKKRRKKVCMESESIPEEILNKYARLGNQRFLKDNIPLSVQKKFQIGYCWEEDCITIPIRRSDGELVGVKARCNRNETGNFKYYYLHPCYISSLLYGYSENYEHLIRADTVYVFESEKSVMQAYGYGFRNCVSIGSSSLSDSQAKLLRQLQPSKIVIMHDKGLDESIINANCLTLSNHLKFTECQIYTWQAGPDIPDKASPTDSGKERFELSLEQELKIWKR